MMKILIRIHTPKCCTVQVFIIPFFSLLFLDVHNADLYSWAYMAFNNENLHAVKLKPLTVLYHFF